MEKTTSDVTGGTRHRVTIDVDIVLSTRCQFRFGEPLPTVERRNDDKVTCAIPFKSVVYTLLGFNFPGFSRGCQHQHPTRTADSI
ncbi:hypothetical protein OUZ56_022172 [Daphnia magna]|uniref:Uncharacterized protein n=1 Tax=Daphnia magna TaxID=35525 RepID=A0ABR0AW49_9CRUS|nr:hypothetical protein OUZ56_022172 [Daphnia magna]